MLHITMEISLIEAVYIKVFTLLKPHYSYVPLVARRTSRQNLISLHVRLSVMVAANGFRADSLLNTGWRPLVLLSKISVSNGFVIVEMLVCC